MCWMFYNERPQDTELDFAGPLTWTAGASGAALLASTSAFDDLFNFCDFGKCSFQLLQVCGLAQYARGRQRPVGNAFDF
jgi:hypothetical protein